MKHCFITAFAVALALAGASEAAADPRDSVFEADSGGTMLVHKASGIRFPDEIAGFRRTGDAVFDAGGNYVGVRYVKPLGDESRLELRIAVVHILGMTPREHYVIAKPMALRGHEDDEVREIAEGPYERPDAGAPGHYGLFRVGADGQETIVGLWAFDRGYWDLRASSEFPLARRAEAEEAMGEFVSAFRGLDQSYEAP